MGKPDLKDPRTLYRTEPFQEQEQASPALQDQMYPKPDCGEEHYRGAQRLLDRKVLITGGDSGIGRAVAIAFAREGADIALQYLPGEEVDAQEVAQLVRDAGRKIALIPADFRKPQIASQVVETAQQQIGTLDTLVLNAAQQIAHPSITELPIEQVQDSFNVNVVAMYAFNPSPHLLDYAATKAAIKNFTINLAQQLADKGIRVNGVAPGPIWTPLQLAQGQLEGALPKFGQNTLLERAGQPAELAPLYVFLASNAASYITGQIYGVTGGESIN